MLNNLFLCKFYCCVALGATLLYLWFMNKMNVNYCEHE